MAERVLVTGASGYLGAWCVARLLQAGYDVNATVRGAAKEAPVRAGVAVEAPAAADRERLRFFTADLESDAGWAQAVAGCTYVLHVASPFPAFVPKDENDLIRPAREGALRVLRAAVAAGVKRVVLTSSVAAVSYGHPRARYTSGQPLTETDWSDPQSKDAAPYIRSKTLAERAARDFMAKEGGATELVTVNPSGIFGPMLGKDVGTSLVIVQRLLKGALPGLPRIGFQIVDVRDVADLHVTTMTSPLTAGDRFIAAGEFLWFADVAQVLKDGLPPPQGDKVPTRRLPDVVLRLVALFDGQARAILTELGRRRVTSSAKAQGLGWRPRPARETLLDSARSLIAAGEV